MSLVNLVTRMTKYVYSRTRFVRTSSFLRKKNFYFFKFLSCFRRTYVFSGFKITFLYDRLLKHFWTVTTTLLQSHTVLDPSLVLSVYFAWPGVRQIGSA